MHLLEEFEKTKTVILKCKVEIWRFLLKFYFLGFFLKSIKFRSFKNSDKSPLSMLLGYFILFYFILFGKKWKKNIGHNLKKNTAPFGRYSFYGMRNPNQKNFVFGLKKLYCV